MAQVIIEILIPTIFICFLEWRDLLLILFWNYLYFSLDNFLYFFTFLWLDKFYLSFDCFLRFLFDWGWSVIVYEECFDGQIRCLFV